MGAIGQFGIKRYLNFCLREIRAIGGECDCLSMFVLEQIATARVLDTE